MYKLYKYDGHYIQGELVSKHSSESAALKAAKKKLTERLTTTKENVNMTNDAGTNENRKR